MNCVHGTPDYILCPKCEEKRRIEEREEKLYAILDKFADAVDKLADRL